MNREGDVNFSLAFDDGITYSVVLKNTASTPVPIDVTGYSARMQIRRYDGSRFGALVAELLSGADITVGTADGLFTADISTALATTIGALFGGVPPSEPLRYRFFVTPPAGTEVEIAHGGIPLLAAGESVAPVTATVQSVTNTVSVSALAPAGAPGNPRQFKTALGVTLPEQATVTALGMRARVSGGTVELDSGHVLVTEHCAGDGSDESVALQAAVDRAIAGGKKLVLVAGTTIRFASTIRIYAETGLVIDGGGGLQFGQGARLIYTGTGNAFDISGSLGLILRGFALECSVSAHASDVILADSTARLQLKHVQIQGGASNLSNSLLRMTTSGNGLVIDSCMLQHYQIGVLNEGLINGCFVYNTQWTHGVLWALKKPGLNWTIADNIVEGNFGQGLITGDGVNPCRLVTIIGNYCGDRGTNGNWVSLQGSSAAMIMGNLFSNVGTGAAIKLDNCRNVICKGNYVEAEYVFEVLNGGPNEFGPNFWTGVGTQFLSDTSAGSLYFASSSYDIAVRTLLCSGVLEAGSGILTGAVNVTPGNVSALYLGVRTSESAWVSASKPSCGIFRVSSWASVTAGSTWTNHIPGNGSVAYYPRHDSRTTEHIFYAYCHDQAGWRQALSIEGTGALGGYSPGVRIGYRGTLIRKRCSVRAASLDFPNCTAGAVVTAAVTVTDADVGDACAVSFRSQMPAGLIVTGPPVVTANTVTFQALNTTGSDINAAAIVVDVDCWGELT